MILTKKPLQFPCEEETVLVLLERVNEAQRLAVREMRETSTLVEGKSKKRKQAKEEEYSENEELHKKPSIH